MRTSPRFFPLALSLILIAFVSTAYAGSEKRYWSPTGYEAIGEFSYHVDFISSHPPSLAEASDQIAQQMRLMIYPLWDKQYITLRGGYDLKISSITLLDGAHARYSANYIVSGKFQMPDKIAGKQKSFSNVQLFLVNEPDSMPAKVIKDGQNLCSGSNSSTDFWAEWDPETEGCPLVKGVDYSELSIQLKNLKNTTETYPEYDRLTDSKGNVLAVLMFGSNSIGDIAELTDPYFKSFKKRQWTNAEIRAVVPGTSASLPKVYELTKSTAVGKLTLQLFFGPSGDAYGDTRPFHYFLKYAVEKAAYVFYDGHAGLGANLSFTRIEEIEHFKITPSSSYQIYDIEACFPFHYYTDQFFNRKKTATDPKGTKGLDLITTIGPSYFDPGVLTHMVTAIEGALSYQDPTSFQSILTITDGSDQYAVDGDDDNPTP